VGPTVSSVLTNRSTRSPRIGQRRAASSSRIRGGQRSCSRATAPPHNPNHLTNLRQLRIWEWDLAADIKPPAAISQPVGRVKLGPSMPWLRVPISGKRCPLLILLPPPIIHHLLGYAASSTQARSQSSFGKGVCAPVLVYACPSSQPLEDHMRCSIVVLRWCSRHHTESSAACEHVISRRSSSATVMPHRAMVGCLHAVITGKGPTSVLALFPFSRSEARFCG
jgi:hypothetical protein